MSPATVILFGGPADGRVIAVRPGVWHLELLERRAPSLADVVGAGVPPRMVVRRWVYWIVEGPGGEPVGIGEPTGERCL